MSSLTNKARVILGSFFSTLVLCTPVWGDDTEIYFGGNTSVSVKPNVLFVLDTSGSMTSLDGGSTTRLDRMKTALNSILNSAQDINVGLMRFSNPGGPILYPVTDIDQALTTTVVEDALSGVTSSSISSGSDDAEQTPDGTVILNSSTLEMTTATIAASTAVTAQVSNSYDDAEENVSTGGVSRTSGDLELMVADGTTQQVVGIRFAAVNVPAGATITSAWIDFEIDEQNTASADPVTVRISAQATDSAASFSSSDSDISSRTKTTANTTWAISANPAVNSSLTTPTLSALVQEVVNRAGWSDNNAMAFVLELVEGTGVRWVESYNGEPNAAPTLHITYTNLSTTSVSNRVSNETDNAIQSSNNNNVSTNIQSIDLAKSGEPVGFRFANVNVPVGATITDARLEFEIDAENTNAVTLLISGEDADNPVTYGNGNNVSSRVKTATNTSWAVNTNPAVNNALTSPNISTIVQHIIDRGGWSANNAMAFIVEHVSGSGKRVVESHKGDSASAAQLHITYTTGASGSSAQTIGLRFSNINIPQGAAISSAIVSFTADNSNSISTNLVFHADDTDNSAPITTANDDLGNTNRPRTTANVGWNAAGTLGPWTNGDEYQSPDISTVIQEVVSRNGWCGGNSMTLLVSGTGLRIAKSYENDPSQVAKLDITYDPDSSPTGCMNQEFGVRVSASSDDAEQNSSGAVNLTSSDLELVTESTTQTIGLRFNNIQLNQGATVTSAYLEFAVDEIDATTATSLTIKGEDTASAATFTTASNNISSRSTTTASATWSISEQWTTANELKASPDIAPIINELLARGDWVPGNSMAFIITGSGKRVAHAYDGSSLAPRLVYITDPNTVPTSSNTVRTRLIEEVTSLDHKSGTPIVDSLYEAALYFRGEGVDYGKTRGSGTSSRAKTRVSYGTPIPATGEISAYTGGTLVRPTGCTTDNLGSSACEEEEITGSPIYTTPISESCQSNHIVLLTDGYASVNTSADKVKTMAGLTACADSGSEACGTELISFLKNSDQHSGLSQDQTIKTHTIGFNFSDPWLAGLATAGGGGYYEASSTAGLLDAFDTIVKTIKAVNTTFVEPSVTINQFNRFAHRDDVYFALFKPQETPKWFGNLKKYRLQGSPATLYDSQNPAQPAIDPSTGFFSIESQSYWSADEDGNVVEKGGAASRIPTTRNVFTSVSGAALSVADNKFHESNALVTKSLLDISAESDAYRTGLVKWARGLDENDAPRYEIGDPLHSRPELVTYDGTSSTLESTIFFGTNEGFLHAIDINTGIEQFAFIPKELLGNLNTFYANTAVTNRPYGLDSGITLWTKDANRDGDLKDSDDFAYLYIGMRRGGNNYYALDVTDVSAPTLMWQIEGGSGDFLHLGQTWSKPIKTRLHFDDADHDVLIFGGGYNAAQDSVSVRTADSIGNAIYMVDALTGALIWSGGGGTGHDETFADMDYSIPSTLNVVDINRDGFAEQIYVGDMGGQLWRFDINQDPAVKLESKLVTGGVIADLAGSDAANNRRFYYPPDLALAVEGKSRYLSVAIGSGYRAHPLNTAVQDRFYMVKVPDIYTVPASYSTWAESDLYDASANLIQQGDTAQQAAAQVALSNDDALRKQGWYINMEHTGEKVLASSLTIQNQIVFTTYEPKASVTGSCNPAQGTSRAYLVSLFDASPMVDVNQDTSVTKEDRIIQLQIGSIPATPTVIDTLESKPTVWVGPERVDQVDTDVESVRTYWIEENKSCDC